MHNKKVRCTAVIIIDVVKVLSLTCRDAVLETVVLVSRLLETEFFAVFVWKGPSWLYSRPIVSMYMS